MVGVLEVFEVSEYNDDQLEHDCINQSCIRRNKREKEVISERKRASWAARSLVRSVDMMFTMVTPESNSKLTDGVRSSPPTD
jgi:hypothetical protein